MADNQKGLAYAVLEIHLIDINNQRPRWPLTSEMVNCPENSIVGQNCATIIAADADYGDNATSTYQVITANSNFGVDTTGSLIPLMVSYLC